MIIVTTDLIPGKNIVDVLGYVAAGTVRSKNVGKDIGASLKSLAGGELHSYTDMQEESRKIAVGRLIEKAEAMGANAVVGLRLTSSNIMASASEIVAYGTAVIIEE